MNGDRIGAGNVASLYNIAKNNGNIDDVRYLLCEDIEMYADDSKDVIIGQADVFEKCRAIAWHDGITIEMDLDDFTETENISDDPFGDGEYDVL